jgi:hypothetical protein
MKPIRKKLITDWKEASETAKQVNNRNGVQPLRAKQIKNIWNQTIINKIIVFTCFSRMMTDGLVKPILQSELVCWFGLVVMLFFHFLLFKFDCLYVSDRNRILWLIMINHIITKNFSSNIYLRYTRYWKENFWGKWREKDNQFEVLRHYTVVWLLIFICHG